MGKDGTGQKADRKRGTVDLAVVIVFSALIAIATFLSIKLPVPLGEITWAPPIYMALSVLAGPLVGVEATAVGSFVGESLNVALLGWPAIYAPGIVWARAPEALIIGWARKRGAKTLAGAMVAATVFETLAFFFSDWAFYTYGLFGYTCSSGAVCANATEAYVMASPDFLTMLDLAFIPVAFILIRAARHSFSRLGYD
ncbi:MAG TPA: ECF transporter S component [Nitrososphaerales archaeon]|nr:ECF transporter S component [Nitrososphaerales archaeon]